MLSATRSRPSLPTTTSRRAGESWTSLCARAAALNDITPAQLGRWTNLPFDDDILSNTQLQRASAALRLPITEISHTVLGRWTDRLYRTQPRSTRSRSGPAWTWIGTTNTCNHCLVEGTQRLEWRLPWVLTCGKHRCYLGPPTHSVPNSETLLLSAYFKNLLLEETTASEKTLEIIDIWRDVITLAQRLGRIPAHGRHDLHPAHHRAPLLLSMTPLAMAMTPEERASTLYSWCSDAGLTRPTRCALPPPRSRAVKDAIDCITAMWWWPRRQLQPASGRG